MYLNTKTILNTIFDSQAILFKNSYQKKISPVVYIALLHKNKKIMINAKRIEKMNPQDITAPKKHYLHAIGNGVNSLGVATEDEINKSRINFRSDKHLKQLLKNVECKLV